MWFSMALITLINNDAGSEHNVLFNASKKTNYINPTRLLTVRMHCILYIKYNLCLVKYP